MSRVRLSKTRIPAQHGRRSGPAAHVVDLGHGTAPLVFVVPQQRSLKSRMALAAVSAVWERRISWAPTWAGIGLFTATGVLALTAPLAALAPALPAVLMPAGWALIVRRHPRSAVRRKAREQRWSVIALSVALAWSSAAVWFGPTHTALTLPWLIGTAAGQAAWSHLRRKTPTAPLAAESIHQA